MKTSALTLSFLVVCVAALAGCGDDAPRPASATKEIVAFSFRAANNPQLTSDVVATIAGGAISATVPFATDVTGLIATFETTGSAVALNAAAQTSGVTRNDFSGAVTYRVTAEDDTTRNYTVMVTIARSTAKELTAYRLLKAENPGLNADVTATINGTAIAATVPFGTAVTALVATFSSTGTSVSVAGTAQVSDTTANNFISPVIYRVTAADGSTQDYTVAVTVAPTSAKEITSYKFLSEDNPAFTVDVEATITGLAIAATVPFGTDVKALVATFEKTGANVTVAGTAQVSGTTPNNFTAPVDYTVIAADGSIAVFKVTVTVALSSAKEITAYKFLSANNPGLTANVDATITGLAIAATVPFGTDVRALKATFSTTGASVAVGETPQLSDVTPNDFTNPVSYTVKAADDSTAVFTVTVIIALNPAKEITEYKFLKANNEGTLAADVDATIAGLAITATVPFGTNVTALKASFVHTGASVAVGETPQVSDVTPNDFANPVSYTVTAADGGTAVFIVTVTVAANPAKEITEYKFLKANNEALTADVIATIDQEERSIVAKVAPGTIVTALKATFVHTGAAVTVDGVPQDSDVTPHDFTAAVSYRVTAADGSSAVYSVTVEEEEAPPAP